MIAKLILWLDDRLGTAQFLRGALRKAFPDHWSFMLGEIALYCFLTLLATGIFLGFFFDPSSQHAVYRGSYQPLQGVTMSNAYASVLRLSFDTNTGLLIRQIHHWAADVFVAAIVVHICRIFFTGAFRRPREINWLVGATLLMAALGAGFTGYSLPDDLLSGTGLRIAYSVLLSVPLVGTWAASLIFGGAFPTDQAIPRLFFLHVFLIPGLIISAISVHLAILWRQKHTQFRGLGRTESNVVGSPLWPGYAMKSVGLLIAIVAVLAALGGFAQINPVWQYGPYDPSDVSSPSQPDWYIGWLEGALRLGPAWSWQVFGHTIPPPFFAGVFVPLVFFGVLFTWPFIEQAITKDHRQHHLLDGVLDVPWRTAVGVGVLTFVVVLTLAGSDDVQATLLHVSLEALLTAYRVLVVAAPVIAALLTVTVVRELRTRRDDADQARERRVVLVRTPEGGFKAEPGDASASKTAAP